MVIRLFRPDDLAGLAGTECLYGRIDSLAQLRMMYNLLGILSFLRSARHMCQVDVLLPIRNLSLSLSDVILRRVRIARWPIKMTKVWQQCRHG